MVNIRLLAVRDGVWRGLAEDGCDPCDQAAIGPKASGDILDHLLEPELTERPRCRVLAPGQRRCNRQEVTHECRYQLRGYGEVALETAQRPGVRLLLQGQQVRRWIAAFVRQAGSPTWRRDASRP